MKTSKALESGKILILGVFALLASVGEPTKVSAEVVSYSTEYEVPEGRFARITEEFTEDGKVAGEVLVTTRTYEQRDCPAGYTLAGTPVVREYTHLSPFHFGPTEQWTTGATLAVPANSEVVLDLKERALIGYEYRQNNTEYSAKVDWRNAYFVTTINWENEGWSSRAFEYSNLALAPTALGNDYTVICTRNADSNADRQL